MRVGERDEHKRQTKVVPKNLDPRWDERLLFPGTLAEFLDTTLVIKVLRAVAMPTMAMPTMAIAAYYGHAFSGHTDSGNTYCGHAYSGYSCVLWQYLLWPCLLWL